MGQADEADRVAAKLAAAAQKARDDAARNAQEELLSRVNATEREALALVPQVLGKLAARGYPGIRQVPRTGLRLPPFGLFGRKTSMIGAYHVCTLQVISHGDSVPYEVLLSADGKVMPLDYSIQEFAKRVRLAEGLSRDTRFTGGTIPTRQANFQIVVEGIRALAE